MTKPETAKILSLLRAAYPNFYRGMSKEDLTDIVNLWHDMFADDNFSVVAAAVKALLANDSKGFPPVIGQVKAYVMKLTTPEEMTDMEAWGLVSQAISNGIYGAIEEFEKLPAVIQRIVGSPNRLREWSMMESDVVQSVVMSGFRKSYAVRAQNERELLAMPPDVRALMGSITSSMSMQALEGEICDD